MKERPLELFRVERYPGLSSEDFLAICMYEVVDSLDFPDTSSWEDNEENNHYRGIIDELKEVSSKLPTALSQDDKYDMSVRALRLMTDCMDSVPDAYEKAGYFIAGNTDLFDELLSKYEAKGLGFIAPILAYSLDTDAKNLCVKYLDCFLKQDDFLASEFEDPLEALFNDADVKRGVALGKLISGIYDKDPEVSERCSSLLLEFVNNYDRFFKGEKDLIKLSREGFRRALFSIKEPERFFSEDLLDDWISYEDFPTSRILLFNNLLRLEELSFVEPEAVEYLRHERGISIFGRYSTETLSKQYLQRDEAGDYSLMLSPHRDWNGAFSYERMGKLINDFESTGDALKILEAGSELELVERLNRLRKKHGTAKFGMIIIHGSERCMTFNDLKDERIFIDGPHTGMLAALRRVFSEGAHVVFDSCNTGHKGGFADMFSRTGVTTYGPADAGCTQAIKMDEECIWT